MAPLWRDESVPFAYRRQELADIVRRRSIDLSSAGSVARRVTRESVRDTGRLHEPSHFDPSLRRDNSQRLHGDCMVTVTQRNTFTVVDHGRANEPLGFNKRATHQTSAQLCC